MQQRTILTRELAELNTNILRLTSMVDLAIERAMAALNTRDI